MWCTKLCILTLSVAFVTCAAFPAPDTNRDTNEDRLSTFKELQNDTKLRMKRNVLGTGECPIGMIRCPFIGCLENTNSAFTIDLLRQEFKEVLDKKCLAGIRLPLALVQVEERRSFNNRKTSDLPQLHI
ncbi:hypothetical protein EVAR_16146_1 [Eumeta japonica]|uniref:Uncharacterized protein n=1 Tax=Eumeta variegata TaxID=151549 RepID=A0A4C1WE87_EUMVA|nr:hypothetical protein EVAR_16146_1 [Eumeta japonica]